MRSLTIQSRQNEETRKEIEQLVKEGNDAELQKRMRCPYSIRSLAGLDGLTNTPLSSALALSLGLQVHAMD